MANGYTQSRAVEERGMQDLAIFFDEMSWRGRWVRTDKGRLSYEFQKSVGDVLFNEKKNGALVAAEIKIEEEDAWGNFFLETWSNLSRYTIGWMFTLDTDLLMYYFIKSTELYVVSFPQLRHWAFRDRHIYKYPEKLQAKYVQKNDTWGRCVPISVVATQIGGRKFLYLRDESKWRAADWIYVPSQTPNQPSIRQESRRIAVFQEESLF